MAQATRPLIEFYGWQNGMIMIDWIDSIWRKYGMDSMYRSPPQNFVRFRRMQLQLVCKAAAGGGGG
jgi:hypothetical protein